jgi:hypothetical protein
MRFASLIARTSSLGRMHKGRRSRPSNPFPDPFDRGLDGRKHAAHLVEDSDRRWVDPLERDDGTAWSWRGGI